MAKEKLTILGDNLKDLKILKEKSVDPKLSKEWDEINYKGLSQKEINKRKEKILSKMSAKERTLFEQKDALRKKAKNQYEAQAKSLKEAKNEGKIIKKDQKIKKISGKLISEEFFGKSMSITKTPKKEKEDKRTISIAADRNTLIKKVPENKSIKNKEKVTLVKKTKESVKLTKKNPEGKTEIQNKILELRSDLPGKDMEESILINKHFLEKFNDPEIIEYANENLKKIDQIEELLKQYNTLFN